MLNKSINFSFVISRNTYTNKAVIFKITICVKRTLPVNVILGCTHYMVNLTNDIINSIPSLTTFVC